MSDFKTNKDLLEAQQQEFTRGGVLLRNIFSITTTHPLMSLIFLLSFGLLTNSLYSILSILVEYNGVTATLTQQSLLTLLLIAIPALVYFRIRELHKDYFISVPLSQKQVLITLASKGRSDFKDTPAYNTYQSLLYTPGGQASNNLIQRVVIVVSESPEVLPAANDFKTYIESSGRMAEVYGVSIIGKSILEIQSQFETMYARINQQAPPYVIAADYTGGTKDMSIALLKASEKKLVVPIYLNAATNTNHSKYS